MLIFHNPHTKIFFGQTLADFVLRNNVSKKSQKYKYLLDYLGGNHQLFGLFIDYKESTLPGILRNRGLMKLEVFFWLLINGINPFFVKIIDNIDTLGKDDIFFSFSLKTLDTEYDGVDAIRDKEFLKIFHLTHFAQNTSLIVQNFDKLKGDFIVAENNLRTSDYFCSFFKNYKKDVYTLPFAFGTKFKKTHAFSDRKNICLSTGAVINISDYTWLFTDFSEYYRVTTLQPIRKEILDNQGLYSQYIQNINADFKISSSRPGLLTKLSRLIRGTGHSYYNFDIVEKYNQYKMFVCGEEINGLPGIGFVEGMACGCAYIGKDDSMYTDLGMIAGVHYIAHDGTLEDIIKKVRYYQEYNDELEKIAINGYNFVQENLSGVKVAATFYKDIIRLAKQYSQTGFDKNKTLFTCSFIKKNEINTLESL